MAQATNNSNKRSEGGWLTASLLFALALCPQAFAAPVSYTYDNINRLTEANYNNGQQIITYTYDAAGNMLSMTTVIDTDRDGIADNLDNCIDVANADQRDTDADGFGNICDPDFDNNLIVNASDLAYFKTKFFSNDPDADLNGDGVVNAADLAILKTMFFQPPGPSGIASTITATATVLTSVSTDQPPYQPVIFALTGEVPLQGQIFDAEGFNDPDISLGDYLAASEWEISTVSDFSDGNDIFHKVLEKTADAIEEEYRRLTVPLGVLVKASDYWIRTRHRDSTSLWSMWSAPVSFTTVAVNPNDLDNNGVDDRYQIAGYVDTDGNGVDDNLEGIRALYDAENGSPVGIKTGSGTLTDLTSTSKNDIPADLLPADSLPYGLFNFRVEGLPVDAANPVTADLSFYFPGILPLDAKWYKYDLAGNAMIDITANVLFNGSQAVLTLTDGGVTDADGVVNGVIVDPGGPVLPAASSTDDENNSSVTTSVPSETGSSSGGGWTLTMLILLWSLIYVLRRYGVGVNAGKLSN